ncbi:MAG: 5'-methylthioadenosine/adenosylhomocysteine nucleosidase [Clostridia bacterium]|nr:5'-methylthioadenosine/adenosylhomocysteine nucleosidase [Clostridia bacterium]
MDCKFDIGVIGAMDPEVDELVARLSGLKSETVGSVTFHSGELLGKRVVIAKCGIGKVFAAIATEAMILKYSPRLIVNTGVGGAASAGLSPLDVVIADRLCQHDMDTSAIGDPKGLVSGINLIYFEADSRAVEILTAAAEKMGVGYSVGAIATGDKFVSSLEEKTRINTDFGAVACEMEGCAVAQVALVNGVKFAVVRAISDSADGSASMEYSKFLPEAARISTALTLSLVEKY